MITNIESLKNSVDIVRVIETYLPLKKLGINLSACCPFHSEKSPSFMVNPQKQFYKCFGCGESGDAFSFVQKKENIGFIESVQRVAEILNFSLEYSNENGLKTSTNPSQTLELISKMAQEKLLQNSVVLDYILKRGFELDDIKKFDIGLMPSKEELEAKFSKKELLESSIFNEYEKNSFSLPMKNRLVFGIRNSNHKMIAFVGRTHSGARFSQNAPKYINSKESYFYKKSQVLYNFSIAKSSIFNEKKCFIVEGYIDCIMLHKNGFKYAVATGGTAFNISHLQLVAKSDCEVIFCFDNDKSGMEANYRALEVCFKAGFYNAKIALLQNKNKSGKLCKDINEALLDSQNPLTFKYLDAFNFWTKMLFKKFEAPKALDLLKEKLKSIQNYYIRDKACQEASEVLNISKDEILNAHFKVAPKATNFINDFISSILQSDDCFYISKDLDFCFLDSNLQDNLRKFLASNERGEITKELFCFANNVILESSDFYKLYLDLSLGFYKNELERAKIKKDLKNICAFSEKIQDLRERIKIESLF